MSRGFIHHVHIADGFADDCEELIHRWLKTETLTYETFCQIWKDMKFGTLYHGRTCGSEVAELSEELIQIAKHYMVANTSNFEESVAGMFIIYALVKLQPYSGFASLRIVPDDVPALNKIEMVARAEKRYDVLYILGSLLIEGPVQYHAAPREHGMEFGIRKYLEGYTSMGTMGVRPHGVFYRQTEELDLLRELRVITKRYSQAKEAIPGNNSRDLNYIKTDLAEELDASLKKMIDGVIEKNEDTTEKTTSVHAIKERAMKLSVDGVKHLQSATVENKSPEKRSPKAVCEIKQKPGAVRVPSPRKPVTSLAKRKTSGKMPRAKRKRKNSNSSNHQEIQPPETMSTSDANVSDDLNLDHFDKEKIAESPETEEREIHISIDSLPVYIREEQGGKLFEIEIIDKLKPKSEDEKTKEANKKHGKSELKPASKDEKDEETRKKIVKLENVTLTRKVEGCEERTSSVTHDKADLAELKPVPGGMRHKRDNGSAPRRRNNRSTVSGSGDVAEVEQIPGGTRKQKKEACPLSKWREKRDLKKSTAKSKFKRLGKLNVANFNEDMITETV